MHTRKLISKTGKTTRITLDFYLKSAPGSSDPMMADRSGLAQMWVAVRPTTAIVMYVGLSAGVHAGCIGGGGTEASGSGSGAVACSLA